MILENFILREAISILWQFVRTEELKGKVLTFRTTNVCTERRTSKRARLNHNFASMEKLHAYEVRPTHDASDPVFQEWIHRSFSNFVIMRTCV